MIGLRRDPSHFNAFSELHLGLPKEGCTVITINVTVLSIVAIQPRH